MIIGVHFRIASHLEYERTKDTLALVNKWTTTVEQDQQELGRLKDIEQKQKELIEQQMEAISALKNERQTKKMKVDEIDEEVAEIRKRLTAQQKEVTAVQKTVTQAEARLEQKRSERHTLLQSCKLEGIRIPLIQGSMDDIVLQEENEEGNQGSLNQGNNVMSQMYAREAALQIDYRQLSEEQQEVDTSEEVRKITARLEKEINDMTNMLQRIQAPNFKAMEK